MKKSIFKKLGGLFLGLAMGLGVAAGISSGSNARGVYASDTTYTFRSKSWASNATGTDVWESGKDGNGFTSNQGVQITDGVSGANATSGKSFSNVSKVVVNYCTNSSKGKGAIKVKVGTTEKSYSVTAPSSGGTTRKNTEDLTFSPAVSGNVTITVDCSKNSIYIWSITITEEQAATPLDKPTGLSATQVGSDVNLSWNAVSNASSYKVVVDGSTTYTGVSSTTKTVSNLTAGNHKFTVEAIGNGSTYTDSGASTEFDFTVEAARELSSITLSGSLTKSTYFYGDSWSNSGLVVTANYTTGDPDTVTSNTTWTYNPTTPTVGTTSVSITASFGDKSTTETYNVTVNKAALSAPTPVFLATGKQITWDAVPNAISYQAKVGSGTYATATSPFDVSSYKGEGEQTFYVKAIGNSNYSDSSEASITFEVKAAVEYELITSTDGLVAGCNYVIGNASKESAVFMSTTENTNNRRQTNSITINDSKITATDDVLVLKLGGTTGAWSLHTENYLGTNGYLAAATGKSNHCRVIADVTVGTITFESGEAIIDFPNSDDRTHLRYNADASSGQLFACYSTAQSPIYMFKEVSTEQTAALSNESVSGMKGDSDTSISITANNFTPTNIEVSYSNANIATVTKGTINNKIIPLYVSFDNVGTTTARITVKGGKADSTVELSITVVQKPASITINNTLKDGYLEVRNSNSASTYGYQQLDITALDTEGKPYEGQLDYTVESGDSNIGLSDSHRVYGKAVGTGVVKVSAHALSSVNAKVNVKSKADTKTGVKSVTFNPSLSANAGDVLSISNVIATKKAKTYFGYSEGLDIDDSELLFSYSEHDYENAVPAASFIYACNEETAVGVSENQTVYVYCTLDSTWSDSFPITVTQTNNPVTGVAISNVSNHAKTITRTDSFQLTLAFTPSNATNKNVSYSLSNQSTGSTITVSQTGLVSAGTRAGSTARVTVTTEDGGFSDYVNVTVVLESMKYVVNEPETSTAVSTVSAGDRVYMVATATDHSNATYEFNGYPGTYGGATSYTTNIAKLQLLEVEAGSTSGTVSFKLSGGDNDGEYISYSDSSTSNSLNHTSTKDATSSWTVDGSTITNANTTARQIWLNWNNGTPRFACYTNKTSTTGYYCPTFIKVTGGNSPYDVTETLFNGIHDNFGSGKTYEWSDSCTAFDEDAWLNACIALTEITNYSSYKLNRAVGNIVGNEVEQFIAKYDIIIGKFGKTHDHLDRYAQGGINYGVRSGVSPLVNIIGENTNTVAIIVIISMVSVTAIVGYFFLRKRKEI